MTEGYMLVFVMRAEVKDCHDLLYSTQEEDKW